MRIAALAALGLVLAGCQPVPAVEPTSGQGRPEVTPLAHSDYIITSLGEELGLTLIAVNAS